MTPFALLVYFLSLSLSLPLLSPPLSLPGPDIDTPEEKKKKQELALAKQAEEQEQMVVMAAGPVNKGTNQPSSASVSVPNHTPPLQRGHASSFSGHEHPAPSSVPYQPPMYVSRQAGPNAVGNHPCHGERSSLHVMYVYMCVSMYYTYLYNYVYTCVCQCIIHTYIIMYIHVCVNVLYILI